MSTFNHFEIPDGTEVIGDSLKAWACDLQNINIPKSVSSITIPNSVIHIGSWAFDNCSSLSSITIPSSVSSINSFAFKNCYNLVIKVSEKK